jgi:hypothetical protein
MIIDPYVIYSRDSNSTAEVLHSRRDWKILILSEDRPKYSDGNAHDIFRSTILIFVSKDRTTATFSQDRRYFVRESYQVCPECKSIGVNRRFKILLKQKRT